MIVLINKFTVRADAAEFERVWQETSEFMQRQPGFLGYQFSRSLSDPNVYVNVARWESAEAHHRVVGSDGFKEHITKLSALATPQPELFSAVSEGEPLR